MLSTTSGRSMETFVQNGRPDFRASAPGGRAAAGVPLLRKAPTLWRLLTRMYRSSRSLHPEMTFGDYSQTAWLFLRQLALHGEFRKWHLAGPSPLQDMLASRPSLISVVRRPYLNAGWAASRRVAAVEEHYRQLTGRGRCLRLEPEASARLAVVTARGSTVELVLDAAPWFIHEGEACLNLFHDGNRIYTLAFSLGFDGAEPVAYGGALQGYGNEQALELYRKLTHAFHGLRPRDLLIGAFRSVCREIGISRWLAISDDDRVSASPYFGTTARVHSSYDAVWSTHGGSPRPDGFHNMPTQLARRSDEEVPARKRSLYRQRYELLDRLEAELTQTLRSRGDAP